MTFRVFAKSAKGTKYRFRVTTSSVESVRRLIDTLANTNNYAQIYFKRIHPGEA